MRKPNEGYMYLAQQPPIPDKHTRCPYQSQISTYACLPQLIHSLRPTQAPDSSEKRDSLTQRRLSPDFGSRPLSTSRAADAVVLGGACST